MLQLETNEMWRYLESSKIINFHDDLVQSEMKRLESITSDWINVKVSEDNGPEYIRKVYEYVRDTFPHSFDLMNSGRQVSQVSCTASDVIRNGHGLCYAKSHLLAAMLRSSGIPTGFCYQTLTLSDENPKLILHAVNAVYISPLKKWIRLDVRGNKEGVNAQFSVDKEMLAFPVRAEFGESDGIIIYAKPSESVISALKNSKTNTELLYNMPTEV